MEASINENWFKALQLRFDPVSPICDLSYFEMYVQKDDSLHRQKKFMETAVMKQLFSHITNKNKF